LKLDKNTRLNENRATANGGIVYFEKDTNSEMHDILIIANEAAGDGGAIYSQGTSFQLTNVQFTMNKAKSATARGGVMFLNGNSIINMENCQFVSSESGLHGGAIYATGSSSLEYDDCSFEGNSAGGNGGAVALDGPQTSLIGKSNTLLGNWADANGGAVYANGAKVKTDQDRFISNSADSGASYYLEADSTLNSTNAFYGEGRASTNGGGIYLQDSNVYLEKGTISDNSGNKDSAGIYCANSGLKFVSSYIKENIGANLFCDHCKITDDKSQCNCNTCWKEKKKKNKKKN